MGALTEVEIFDCLAENFRLAAQNCEHLAVAPARGPIYNAFRHQLLLIEGACQQAAVWRQDCRWYDFGIMMGETHKKAGRWLRQHYPRPLFVKLAENLRMLHMLAQQCQHNATGRVGMILPDEMPAPTRTQSRPVQVLIN